MFSALHDCGHVSVWRTQSSAPNPGELLTCATCGHAARVTALFGPWRTKCLDCTRVDAHSTFRTTVVRAATRHAQEWTTHRVQVWQFGDKDSIIVLTSGMVGTQSQLISDAPF